MISPLPRALRPSPPAMPDTGRERRRSARIAWRVGASVSRSWGFARFVGLLDRLDRRSEHLLTVLMYHRVDDFSARPELDPGLLSATPADFARQMAYLAARRPVLSLDDAIAIRRGERKMPPGAVMVTFDDAYRDFAANAWPVLRKHGIPVTMFVATGYPDRPELAFWWDRLNAALVRTRRIDPLVTPAGVLRLDTRQGRCQARPMVRDWVWNTPHDEAMAGVDEIVDALDVPPLGSDVLSWDELRALDAQGVVLAPQTRSHPMLSQLSLERAQREILDSVCDLERETGRTPHSVFAFPAGGASPALVEWLGDIGFDLAFTTARGANDVRTADWLKLRRINMGCRSTVAVMRGQMLTWVARPGSRAQTVLARI